MGNTENKNSKLKIYIETEKNYYNSGSIIKGVVFVDARDNFQYNALFIRVEGNISFIYLGDEFCQWF